MQSIPLARLFARSDCRYNIARRGLSRVAYPGQGNARARMWDRREVEQPTSFRLTLITLNPGSWRQKGKGITMNTINGMTFYDSLTKLTIGFLLTWWCLPKILYSNIQIQDKDLHEVLFIALYIVVCYWIGYLWQAVLCVFSQDDIIWDDRDVVDRTKLTNVKFIFTDGTTKVFSGNANIKRHMTSDAWD